MRTEPDSAARGRLPTLFQPAASAVIQSLRLSVASTLSEVGDFAKPADVRKVLQVDRTLARQLFWLASTAEPIGNGGLIPSRTSIDRFLTAAKSQGVEESRIKSVSDAYRDFEHLVEIHAGDRATFNSMVSASGGVDEDWLLTNLQHRRNAFRAICHSLGVQAKTRLLTYVVKGDEQNTSIEMVVLGGSIGMRVLRELPSVRVFGTQAHANGSHVVEPLGLSETGGGYLLEKFCTSPLPSLAVRDSGGNGKDTFRELVVERPAVGNFGSSTLMFGAHVHKVPMGPREPLRLIAAEIQSVEKLVFDALVSPGLRGTIRPTGHAVIGPPDRLGMDPVKLPGDFHVEFLGKGPKALATPEVPRYADMLAATGSKLDWSLNDYDAWRIRVDFPLYQSHVSMVWDPADATDGDGGG